MTRAAKPSRPPQESAGHSKTARGGQDARPLELGKPVARAIVAGEKHLYQIKLTAGQYLHVVAEHGGGGVGVSFIAPDAKQLILASGWYKSPQRVQWIVETAGVYWLELGLEKWAAPVDYEVKVEELRQAEPQDRDLIAAIRAYEEAERMRSEEKSHLLPKAAERFQEALQLWRALDDRRWEAKTLWSLGVVHSSTGEYQKAFDYFGQALPLWRTVGDLLMEANTLNFIGEAYHYLSEYQKALDTYDQALPLWRNAEDRSGEGWVLNNIGSAYNALGDKQKALDYYNQSLLAYRSAENPAGQALEFTRIGAIQVSQAESRRALKSLQQAMALWQDSKDPRRNRTLHYLGEVYASLGETRLALGYYDPALQQWRVVGERFWEAITLGAIGRAYASIRDEQKALDHFGQALRTRQEIGDRRGQAETLYHLARFERDRGRLGEACERVKETIKLVEDVRAGVVSQELRASYLATVRDYYELYVDLLMQLHERRPSEGFDRAALRASEQARARSLLEMLAEARADIRQGVDPQLVERERQLQQQINAKASQQARLFSRKETSEQAGAVAKEIATLTDEYRKIEAQIRAASPRYAALTQPQPLSAAEIQQLLDDDTLLLEYALGKERSYLWAVARAGIASYQLPKRAAIEQAARRAYDLLTARNQCRTGETSGQRKARVKSADAQFPQAAAALSRMLLGPVAAQLGTKRLLVVTQGALQFIPLAALPVPQGQQPAVSSQKPGRAKGGLPTAAYRPLLVEHEIVNLPSASVLAALRRDISSRPAPPKTAAVLADPVFTEDDERVRTLASTVAKGRGDQAAISSRRAQSRDVERALEDVGGSCPIKRIPRLSGTRWEAEQIAARVPAEQKLLALDFAANRETATSPDLGQYRILHFATHALINTRHPELSGIVLSLVDERGRPQDGFLRAHEIFNLKLPSDLVVLSACQTGLGKEVEGEGLIGLTRGFMYAGAPRVAVSLWSLDDRATAELMVKFYERMLGSERLTPAAALRAAQVEMWKGGRWLSPYYWAAFVLQGEWK